MGWSYCYSHTTKKHVVDDIMRDERIKAHRLVGNTLYTVIELSNGERLIGVNLIRYDKTDKCYGTKMMAEDCGPVVVDCPLSLLAMAPNPPATAYGPAWRERVLAYHAKRKNRPQLATGDRVRVYGQDYQIEAKREPTGWLMRSAEDRLFKLTGKALTNAEKIL